MPQNLDIFSSNLNEENNNVQHSLQLFGPSQLINSKKQPQKQLKKNDHFRQQIRKTANQKLFRAIRNQIMDNDQSQRFLSFLRQNSQRFSVNERNLETLIECVKNHMSSADFSLKIISQDIKIYKQMSHVLMDECKNLTTYTKAIIVKGLIYLTYFQESITSQIATTNFIDFSIGQIKQLKIDNDDQVRYLMYYISLMMNISAIQDKNINLFFIESNLINEICQKIDLTFVLKNQIEQQQKPNENKNSQNSLQKNQKLSPLQLIQLDITDLCFTFIEFLKNLCRETDKPTTFVQRIISYFTLNQFVMKHNTEEIFSLLTEVFKNEDNILMLFENCQFGEWYGQLVDICQHKFINSNFNQQNSALTIQQKNCFANFLRNFITVNQQQGTGQITMFVYIKNLIQFKFLSQFLIQTTQKHEKELVFYALQAYQIISNEKQISVDILLTVLKGRNYQDLICAFINAEYLSYFKTGALMTKIIINLLNKSNDILKVFMENKLFDSINYYFKSDDGLQNKPIESIILMFDLLTQMVECQSQIRPNNKNEIVRLIIEQGLIKQIQKMQNHSDSEVYQKAEMFIKYTQTFL